MPFRRRIAHVGYSPDLSCTHCTISVRIAVHAMGRIRQVDGTREGELGHALGAFLIQPIPPVVSYKPFWQIGGTSGTILYGYSHHLAYCCDFIIDIVRQADAVPGDSGRLASDAGTE